jgi:hypothetical protein
MVGMKILLSIVGIVVVLIGGYFVFSNYAPHAQKDSGLFVITTIGDSGPFCGKERITRKADNLNIVTLLVCEDNIASIRARGDWVIVEMDTKRSYRKNLITGEDEIQNAGGVGGLSKVE